MLGRSNDLSIYLPTYLSMKAAPTGAEFNFKSDVLTALIHYDRNLELKAFRGHVNLILPQVVSSKLLISFL